MNNSQPIDQGAKAKPRTILRPWQRTKGAIFPKNSFAKIDFAYVTVI